MVQRHEWPPQVRSPRTISQVELRELVDNMATSRRTNNLFNDVRKRLIAGAAVEPGEYVPSIEIGQGTLLTQGKLRAVFGAEEAENIINRCAEASIHRLKIRTRDGKALGFRELGAAPPHKTR